MKNIVDSFIQFLIKSVIVIALVGACIILFIFALSKIGNVPMEDTISYVQSFKPENTGIVSSIVHSKNILLSDSVVEPISQPISDNTNDDTTYSFYYYQQLDEPAKIIYNTLYDNIDNLKKNHYVIDFDKKFNSLLNEPSGQEKLNRSFQSALDAFFYDHPELFYIDLTKINLFMKYTKFGPITTYTVSIIPKNNYNYLSSSFKTEEQVNDAIDKLENVKDTILNKINTKDTDYNKIKKVHDSLVSMLEYDTNAEEIHSTYGALIYKKAVCEGYAKAFKYILDSLNIDCILVCGNATNTKNQSEAHMWNYVKLDNNWYGVDVTWDDPIVIGGISKNTLRHTYLCKGSRVFDKSHTPSESISNEGQTFNLPTLSNKNY